MAARPSRWPYDVGGGEARNIAAPNKIWLLPPPPEHASEPEPLHLKAT